MGRKKVRGYYNKEEDCNMVSVLNDEGEIEMERKMEKDEEKEFSKGKTIFVW